jgi:hypothetical protein
VEDIDFKVISVIENLKKIPENQNLEGKISRGYGNT